jgi:DNA-binding MarR family transcriptional regulator
MERDQLLTALTCTNTRMRRATRVISDFYNAIMEPTGLHGNQFMLLIPAYLKDGLTISQLAEMQSLDRTTLARNLKLMEERGLIAIRPGEDQRTRAIYITEHGRQLLAEAFPLWEQAQQQVNALLGESELAQLYSTLDKLQNNFDKYPSSSSSE